MVFSPCFIKKNIVYIVLAPGQVDVPRQLVVNGDPASIPSIVEKAGLKLPLGRVCIELCLFF